MKTTRRLSVLLLCLFLQAGVATADVQTLEFQEGSRRLVLEVLDDQVVHFRWVEGAGPAAPIPVSAYVDPDRYPGRYPGPARFEKVETGFRTAGLSATVMKPGLALELRGAGSEPLLVRLTPVARALQIEGPATHHLYGLGEQFPEERFGSPHGGWLGNARTPGVEPYGNAMVGYHGGAVGNAQFPVLYALCRPGPSFAVFMDDPYVQEWDFTGSPWRFRTSAADLRGFAMVGPGLPELRADYMGLVGRPPVPPRRAFGLWVSEYGFDNWAELLNKLKTLRKQRFPVDGFVLDLQWFGGIGTGAEDSPMGRVAFDETSFPEPEQMIRRLREDEGLGLITIEEAYISKGLDEHRKLARRGFLARRTDQKMSDPAALEADAFYINENPWWGLGGMLDFTNPEAGRYWHKLKRQTLVDFGIVGHWTDLGEPEMFRHKTPDGQVSVPFYFAGSQADIHNLFALSWARSIAQGYKENRVRQRPLILTRTGGPGIQRYGAALWSGDIGTNFGSLATHYNVQGHMSMSGIDFFGADVGGFHRSGLEGGESELDELYTQWFADACAFDVPIRPHTENLSNAKETAPDRIGLVESNLSNLRLRYRLLPYYYSLAHRAHGFGEAVVAPLAYHFRDLPRNGDDLDPWTLGDVKMIGPYLLSGMVAREAAITMDVYLPPGDWVNYHTNVWEQSPGRFLRAVPLYRDGLLQLPLYARAGAIIPHQHVDDQTMNSFGRRLDGSVRNDLILRVVPGKATSEFTLYEDDGTTVDYLKGELARTRVFQESLPRGARVVVQPTQGNYRGAPRERVVQVDLNLPEGAKLRSVRLDGQPLDELTASADTAPGFYRAGGLVTARSAKQPVKRTRTFEFIWK